MTTAHSTCDVEPRAEKPSAAPWRLEGALTIYTVETLRPQMIERLSQPSGLVLDLGMIDSCDCAGLQLLFAARKSADKNSASFRAVNLSPTIVTVAESLGLDLNPITDPATKL